MHAFCTHLLRFYDFRGFSGSLRIASAPIPHMAHASVQRALSPTSIIIAPNAALKSLE